MNSGILLDLLSKIKAVFPSDTADICDAFELLNLAFDGARENANKQMKLAADVKDYEKTQELLLLSQDINKIQGEVLQYTVFLNEGTDAEDEESEDEEDIFKEQKEIPDYSEYVVDSTVPHTLYENFTHKKAAAFSLNGHRYEAKDWKDVLLKTCNLLSEIDADMFYGFVNDTTMRGRKNAYFSTQYIERKNAKLTNIDVYVWTNLSANHIKTLIRKMLKKFDLKISDFYVYFRADYTALHTDEKTCDIAIEKDATADKIGKYIRLKLRELSNQQKNFSTNELIALQSKEWCKANLNLDFPLFKKCDPQVDISAQVKIGSYIRYWKEIFEFGGEKFLVTSQWYDRHRNPFDNWLNTL